MNDSLPGAPPEPESCIGASRKSQIIEVAIFLFLIMPSVLISLMAVRRGGLTFSTVAFSIIFRDLALVALILFFLWHNREPRARIGWVARNPLKEALVGLLLFVPVAASAGAVAYILRGAGFSLPDTPPPFLTPQGAGEIALAIFLVVIVAIAEETIFRGYLILRFTTIAGNTIAAAAISSFFFSLGHGYQGSAGILAVGFLGFLYSLVYLWRGSVIAPTVMHFIQNFLGIVVAPWLAGMS